MLRREAIHIVQAKSTAVGDEPRLFLVELAPRA